VGIGTTVLRILCGVGESFGSSDSLSITPSTLSSPLLTAQSTLHTHHTHASASASFKLANYGVLNLTTTESAWSKASCLSTTAACGDVDVRDPSVDRCTIPTHHSLVSGCMPSWCLGGRVGPELTPSIRKLDSSIAFFEGDGQIHTLFIMPSDAGRPALTPAHQPESLSAIMSTDSCVATDSALCNLPSSHHLHISRHAAAKR